MKSILIFLVLLQLESSQAFQVHEWTARKTASSHPWLTLRAVSQSDYNDKYTTLPRLYVGNPDKSSVLAQDVHFSLAPDQAHYVTKVMRIDGKRKKLLRIFDGHSGEWLVEIDVEARRRGDVSVTCLQQLRQQQDNDCESDPWVVFAPLKKARVKWMLEKCTELGATRFIAVSTERTDQASLRSMDMDKWHLQLVEASEQSERLLLPILSNSLVDKEDDEDDTIDLSCLLTTWEASAEGRHLLVCRERSAATPILSLLNQLESCNRVAFLTGPEGGWSADEEALLDSLCQDSKVMHAVSLGSNVLRAETAAMTAIAAYTMYIDSVGI